MILSALDKAMLAMSCIFNSFQSRSRAIAVNGGFTVYYTPSAHFLLVLILINFNLHGNNFNKHQQHVASAKHGAHTVKSFSIKTALFQFHASFLQ